MDGQRCAATAKRTGKPCRRAPVPGASVCSVHGGAAPQTRAKAAERVLEREARALLARLEVAPVGDPLIELSRLAGQVLAWRDTCAELVNQLSSVRYEGAGSGEQLRAEVVLFERALDRCAHLLVAIARLDIDTRLAAIADRQADVIVRAVEAGLAAVGVTGEAVQVARSTVARHLRTVDREPGR